MEWEKALKELVRGEVFADEETRTKYSTDASVFRVMPEAVVCPKDAKDVKALVKFAATQKKKYPNFSLTARAAGTDMGGGPLNDSVILDFTKYFNHIKEVRATGTKGMAVVEPGVFYRDFEKAVAARGLLLPSYPASKGLCAVGGMVANNSGGEKTLAYGKTEDYVVELKVVFSDGNEYVVKPLTPSELKKKMAEKTFEGGVYKKLFTLLEKNQKMIMAAKPDVSKNSAGYYLWNVWDGTTFNLPKLIVGSQGTLGLITEITFRLVRPKPHSLMMVIFLHDIAPVADITKELLKFRPESLECYDNETMKLAIRFFPSILARVKTNPILFALSFLPDLWMMIRYGFPKLVVMAEFTGESEDVIYARLQEVKKALTKFNVPEHLTRHEAEEGKYWTIRRESFNLLREHVKGKNTAPVVDDVVVKPEYMAAFLPELRAILDKYKDKLISTIAGHNGNGNFHIIPLMDFKDPSARAILKPLMDEVYALTLRYKGSITAEHNDGLIRTPYLKLMYGEKIVKLFEETKKIFDPLGIFNPRKKVGGDMAYALEHIK